MINFFPPSAGGGVYRPLSFVRYLSGSGWDVTVITPRPGEFWINDPGLESKVPPEVRVIRTKSFSGQRILANLGKGKQSGSSRSSSRFGLMRKAGEFVLIPDTYVGWVPFAAGAAAKLCRSERFDMIYSTSPPDSTHLAAGRTSRRFHLPWVADFRDPWISLYLRDPATPIHAAIHKNLEKRVSAAKLVLVTTTWQKEKLLSLFPSCRVEKIPNGYEEEDFPEGLAIPDGDGKLKIVHAGMLTLGRSSRPFLEGLRLFLDRRPGAGESVEVTFIGPRESANEEWVGRLGLGGNVRFRDNIAHSECVNIERASDLLLLIKHDDPRYTGLVPGKLFEYIGARRPILAIAPDGEAASIVRDLNRGEVVPAGDREAVAAVIDKFFILHKEGRLGSSYSLGVVREYSRRVLAGKLELLLRSIAGNDHSLGEA